MFQCAIEVEHGFDPAFFQMLYRHLDGIPDGSSVWIASYDPTDVRISFRNRSLWPKERGIVGRPPSFATVFNIRQIVFIVHMTLLDSRVGLEHKHIRPLLPPRSVIRWPFKRKVDRAVLAQIPEFFHSGGGAKRAR
jgi:hypothetical protein